MRSRGGGRARGRGREKTLSSSAVTTDRLRVCLLSSREATSHARVHGPGPGEKKTSSASDSPRRARQRRHGMTARPRRSRVDPLAGVIRLLSPLLSHSFAPCISLSRRSSQAFKASIKPHAHHARISRRPHRASLPRSSERGCRGRGLTSSLALPVQKRGHVVTFSLLILFSLIEWAIAAYLVNTCALSLPLSRLPAPPPPPSSSRIGRGQDSASVEEHCADSYCDTKQTTATTTTRATLSGAFAAPFHPPEVGRRPHSRRSWIDGSPPPRQRQRQNKRG